MPGPEFSTTSWSLILSASSDPTSRAGPALASLCQTYWNPVYAFIRRNGHDPDKAQDLTQEFFARLIEKKYLGDADRSRGRFRTFLLTAVKHFLANEWDRANAQKRGGGQAHLSIDAAEAEQWYVPAVVDDVTPENLFQRRWALSLLEKVLSRLRLEYAASGKSAQFSILEPFLGADGQEAHYESAANRGGVSPAALRMSVLRMRRKYRDLLREEIAETVVSADQVDEEIRFLLSTLSG